MSRSIELCDSAGVYLRHIDEAAARELIVEKLAALDIQSRQRRIRRVVLLVDEVVMIATLRRSPVCEGSRTWRRERIAERFTIYQHHQQRCERFMINASTPHVALHNS